ncbi:hypothetical protein ACFL2V_03620 [Pseudomonadota bacterium]
MADNLPAALPSMPQPNFLLSTKLSMPALQQRHVVRARIQNKLIGNGLPPLSVVCAPAGFGKTTALVCCLGASQLPVAWLALDESDNDPDRFLEYLIGALQSVIPDVGCTILQRLNAPSPPKTLGFLPGLINELHACPSAFVLVLDDYHLINTNEVHQLVYCWSVRHLPCISQ